MAARISFHFNAHVLCYFLIITFRRTRHFELVCTFRRFLLEDDLAAGYLHVLLILCVLAIRLDGQRAAGIC